MHPDDRVRVRKACDELRRGDDASAIIERADRLMYAAKQRGKGQAEVDDGS